MYMTRNRGLQTCCSNYIQCMTRRFTNRATAETAVDAAVCWWPSGKGNYIYNVHDWLGYRTCTFIEELQLKLTWFPARVMPLWHLVGLAGEMQCFLNACFHIYCKIINFCGTFNFIYFMGKKIHEIKCQRKYLFSIHLAGVIENPRN